MVANKIIYWKCNERFKHLSYYSLYDIDWLFDTDSNCRRDRLSWDSMYIMDEDDKVTINGYYCMK